MKEQTSDNLLGVFAAVLGLAMMAGFIYAVWRYGPSLMTWTFASVNVQPGEAGKKLILGVVGAVGTAGGTAVVAYVRRIVLLRGIACRVAVLIAAIRALGDIDASANDVGSQINADVAGLLFKQQELDRVAKFVEPEHSLVVLQAVAAMGRLSQATPVEVRSAALRFVRTIDLDSVLRSLLNQVPIQTPSIELLAKVLETKK